MLVPEASIAQSRRPLPAPRRLRRALLEFIKYFLVSAAALGLDWGLLVVLTEIVGLGYLTSAAIGYGAGLLLGYGLSVTFVFADRRMADARMEFLLFAGIGLLGLALTQAAMAGLVEFFGLPYALAKGPVAGLVFLVNFGLRRALLFSAPPPVIGSLPAQEETASHAKQAGADIGALPSPVPSAVPLPCRLATGEQYR